MNRDRQVDEPGAGDILIYETADHRIDVRLEQETVWLTQRQMAELFDTRLRMC